ncbi:MAG: hypothetical protein GY859_34780, partial [Desulfobacterales bacterium]|nr:hypothetical protein [Desulfobacterales bacterium]
RDDWGLKIDPTAEKNLGKTFDDFDLNSDGEITLDEVDWLGRIIAFDQNGDGAISREELAALFPAEESPGKTFDELDLNSDGKITPDEVDSPGDILAGVDQNGDGGISSEELASILPAGQDTGNTFHEFDFNFDDQITPDELNSPGDIIGIVDPNGDGGITSGEWASLFQSGEGQGAGQNEGDPDDTPPGEVDSPLNILAGVDQNGDGAVNREEWAQIENVVETLALNFDNFDFNSDDQVTPDEVDAPLDLFAVVDPNGDGALSSEEWGNLTDMVQSLGLNFDDFDLNSDGEITSDEVDSPLDILAGVVQNGGGASIAGTLLNFISP